MNPKRNTPPSNTTHLDRGGGGQRDEGERGKLHGGVVEGGEEGAGWFGGRQREKECESERG